MKIIQIKSGFIFIVNGFFSYILRDPHHKKKKQNKTL